MANLIDKVTGSTWPILGQTIIVFEYLHKSATLWTNQETQYITLVNKDTKEDVFYSSLDYFNNKNFYVSLKRTREDFVEDEKSVFYEGIRFVKTKQMSNNLDVPLYASEKELAKNRIKSITL
jgi:hypothetical protein